MGIITDSVSNAWNKSMFGPSPKARSQVDPKSGRYASPTNFIPSKEYVIPKANSVEGIAPSQNKAIAQPETTAKPAGEASLISGLMSGLNSAIKGGVEGINSGVNAGVSGLASGMGTLSNLFGNNQQSDVGPTVRASSNFPITQVGDPNWLYGSSNPTQQGITANNTANQVTDTIGEQLNVNADRVSQNQRFQYLVDAMKSLGSGSGGMTGFHDVNSRQFGALPGQPAPQASQAAAPAQAPRQNIARQPVAQSTPPPAGGNVPFTTAGLASLEGTGVMQSGGSRPAMGVQPQGVSDPSTPGAYSLASNPGQNLPAYSGVTTGGQEAANNSRNQTILGASNGVQPLTGNAAIDNARNLEMLASGNTTQNQMATLFRDAMNQQQAAPTASPQATQAGGGSAPYTTTINTGAMPESEIENAVAGMKGGNAKAPLGNIMLPQGTGSPGTPDQTVSWNNPLGGGHQTGTNPGQPSTLTPSPTQTALQQQFSDNLARNGAISGNAFSREAGAANRRLGLESQKARASQGLDLAGLLAALNSDQSNRTLSQRKMLTSLMGVV